MTQPTSSNSTPELVPAPSANDEQVTDDKRGQMGQLHPLLAVPPSVDSASAFGELREADPIHWIGGLGAWLVTRHDDVRQFFSDPRLTADPRVYEHYHPPTVAGAQRWLREMPFRATTPSHEIRDRRMVSSSFTARSVARSERRIGEVVDEFKSRLCGRSDVVDLVGEYSAPISQTVIARILGVPAKGEDEATFRRLATRATRSVNPIINPAKRQKGEIATVEICNYVEQLVLERETRPSEDLISDLLRASKTTRATTTEIVRVVAALVSAGTGTTSLGLSRALRTLIEHPEHLEELRSNRSLIPDAVEELLRYHCGLMMMPRYGLEDFTHRGKQVRQGQLIGLCLLSANRDPRVFEDPDRLDFHRDTRQALSFGHGSHYCIGANLARAQMRIAIEAALDFIRPGARVLSDQIRWSARGVMSQIRSLPVDLGPSA